MLILVSGSTVTVGKLAEKRVANLGHLLTPSNRNGMQSILKTGLPWAADNGAFSGFDPVRFRWFLKKISGQPRCLFVVCPDVVSDAKRTLEMFGEWKNDVAIAGPLAFVLQDGQEDLDLPEAACYFIGGSTKFKLSKEAMVLAAEGKKRGAWIHMGRVNSRRRLVIAEEMGCSSVDGSSLSMFGDKYIHKFCKWASVIKSQPLLY